MKKVRKGKKMILTIAIVAVVIIAIILVIVNIVKKKQENPSDEVQEQQQVFELPDTQTESGMDVQKVSMEYREEYNQTVVTMRITNTTSQKVNEENFKAILIGADDSVLGSMPTGTSMDLEVGEQCEVTAVYAGDLTSTQRITLDKME